MGHKKIADFGRPLGLKIECRCSKCGKILDDGVFAEHSITGGLKVEIVPHECEKKGGR